jgi:nicotinamidase-related amidase
MHPKQALIIVDMQKDFVDSDGKLSIFPALGETKTTKLIQDVADYITNFKGRIFYTLDTHDEDSCEFDSFPSHCIEGTDGHALTKVVADALIERERKDMRRIGSIKKASFTGSRLTEYLAETYPDVDYTIIGVCTHICVHDVASSLVNKFKEVHNKIPKIKIVKDLTGDFDQEMADFALKRLADLYGIEVK